MIDGLWKDKEGTVLIILSGCKYPDYRDYRGREIAHVEIVKAEAFIQHPTELPVDHVRYVAVMPKRDRDIIVSGVRRHGNGWAFVFDYALNKIPWVDVWGGGKWTW